MRATYLDYPLRVAVRIKLQQAYFSQMEVELKYPFLSSGLWYPLADQVWDRILGAIYHECLEKV